MLLSSRMNSYVCPSNFSWMIKNKWNWITCQASKNNSAQLSTESNDEETCTYTREILALHTRQLAPLSRNHASSSTRILLNNSFSLRMVKLIREEFLFQLCRFDRYKKITRIKGGHCLSLYWKVDKNEYTTTWKKIKTDISCWAMREKNLPSVHMIEAGRREKKPRGNFQIVCFRLADFFSLSLILSQPLITENKIHSISWPSFPQMTSSMRKSRRMSKTQ